MGYTGGDASLHRHSIPNQLERYLSMDFELGAAEQKALAGIVKGKDTLDMALLYGQAYGRNPTNAGSPTLEHPMWSLRISGPVIDLPKEVWGTAYDKLVDLLPEDTKSKLLEELAKPYQERSTEYVALQGVLETAAKYVTMLETANKDIDPASSAAINREANLSAPFGSIANLDAVSTYVLHLAENLLKEFPQFSEE